ncbi:hypothetical protein BD413DRAFT_615933 [Trametes elegans]|nr:hypothetical protein BD413DRAFT_615933 [Trametes elegans]
MPRTQRGAASAAPSRQGSTGGRGRRVDRLRSLSPSLSPSLSTQPTSSQSYRPSSPANGAECDDYYLKQELTEYPTLMSYEEGQLSVVSYPSDAAGTPIPLNDLIAYSRTHEFLNNIFCFCEFLYGTARNVRIFIPSKRNGIAGHVCIGCRDWMPKRVNRDGRASGCRFFLDLTVLFSDATTWRCMPLKEYPIARGAFIGKGVNVPSRVHGDIPTGTSSTLSTTSGTCATPTSPHSVELELEESTDSRTDSGSDIFAEIDKKIAASKGPKRKRKIVPPPPGYQGAGQQSRYHQDLARKRQALAQPARFSALSATAATHPKNKKKPECSRTQPVTMASPKRVIDRSLIRKSPIDFNNYVELSDSDDNTGDTPSSLAQLTGLLGSEVRPLDIAREKRRAAHMRALEKATLPSIDTTGEHVLSQTPPSSRRAPPNCAGCTAL